MAIILCRDGRRVGGVTAHSIDRSALAVPADLPSISRLRALTSEHVRYFPFLPMQDQLFTYDLPDTIA